MTKAEMMRIVKAQLALDLNCMPEALDGEKDNFVFVAAAENEGRRMFARESEHLDMLTMGASIVVSATPGLLERAKRELEGKTRDDAFSSAFLLGHSLYYLPDLPELKEISAPSEFQYEWIESGGFEEIYKSPGFYNAVQYDLNHPRPDVLAIAARSEGKIAALAGVSADCEKMWQIGIDVLPGFRSRGLAAYLTNALARAVLSRGIVPYYGTASSNVPSQKTAHRAGFTPAWMCVYKTR